MTGDDPRPSPGRQIKSLPDNPGIEKQRQDIRLRSLYATWVLAAVGVQVLIADLLFAGYLIAAGSGTPEGVIDVFLSATVVQVIGVLLVITRDLFPRGGDKK